MSGTNSDPRLQELSDRLDAVTDRMVKADQITQEEADALVSPQLQTLLMLLRYQASQKPKEASQ